MTSTNLPFNLSWKAILAFLFPLITAVVTSLVAWLLGGEVFDVEPIKVTAAGLVTSALALLGAWLGKPGAVTLPQDEEQDLHDAVGA